MKERLCFPFLVLGAQVLVPALTAACRANRISCVTVHAYLHIEQPGFGFRELCHY